MMFKRVMYIMILFGLTFNTGKVNSSEIYLKGEFSITTLPSYLQDATNFRLMRTGELIEDETAFGGVCAKVGAGYWPINTLWKFSKFDALYTLYVHAKIKKPPSDPNSSIFYCGFYGRPGKRFWMFTRSVKAKDTKDGEWKTYKICSFHPRRDQHVYIAKGSASEVYVDLIWFEEEGKKSPEIPLYWNKVNYEDSHWKKISLPFTWEGEKFKGTLLFRKKVIIPKEWQSKGIIALKCPGEKTLVYINGNKLRRAKENLYFIPSPFINFGKENLVAIQVYGILNKGYVIPPLGKLYLLTSTLSAPNWIKESNVRKVSLGGYKILFRVEKDVLKPRELSRVDLTIIEGKNVNPYLYPKLYLENIPFPLSPATKLGYHTTWISSPKMGKYTLKLAIAKRKVSLCEIKVIGNTPSLIKGYFPIGVHYWPANIGMERKLYYEKTLPNLKEYGIDTLIAANVPFSEYPFLLKIAEQHGLKVIGDAFLSVWSKDPRKLYESAQKTIGIVSPYKSFISYYITDEPSVEGLKHTMFKKIIFNGLDPERFCFYCLNMSAPEEQVKLIKEQGYQAIIFDCYGSPKGFEGVVKSVSILSEKYNLPFWPMMPVHTHLSPEALCLETYLSLAYGAKGLFYYTYTPAHGKNTGLIDRDLKPRPQLEALKNIFQKIKPILPILLSLRKAEDIATTETPECVVTTRKSPEGNYYLFVVNKDTGKEKTVKIKLDEKKFISLPALIDLFTKKRMEIEKSVFSFTLKPGEGKIYQVVKK